MCIAPTKVTKQSPQGYLASPRWDTSHFLVRITENNATILDYNWQDSTHFPLQTAASDATNNYLAFN